MLDQSVQNAKKTVSPPKTTASLLHLRRTSFWRFLTSGIWQVVSDNRSLACDSLEAVSHQLCSGNGLG